MKYPGCPHYDDVPKDPAKNREWRRYWLRKGTESNRHAKAIFKRCSDDILWYVNTFLWLFEPRAAKRIPFITYEFQDETFCELRDAVTEGYDVCVAKSRDMGASWSCLSTYEWFWHFHDLTTFLMMSRRESLVYKKGDPAALFSKIDFLHQHQPGWLLPKATKVKMHYENNDLDSVIDGESTNEFAGVADRRLSILLDEYSKMDNAPAIFRGTRDVTRCRIFNFTPSGQGHHSHNVAHHPKMKQIRLHWSRHPDKRAGLYRVEDGYVEILDTEWHDQNPGYKFVKSGPFFRNGELRSQWYDGECDRADHPREIAQELDINFEGSDSLYFEPELISKCVREMALIPFQQGEVDFHDHLIEVEQFTPIPDGRLLLWCHLDQEGNPPNGESYVVGVDVATGTGLSNSSISVFGAESGEQFAEFASPHIQPHELADMAVALCRWFVDAGGMGAFLIWEAPGPGRNFGDRVREIGYSRFYWRRNEDSIVRKSTEVPGWWPTKDAKRSIYGNYKRGLQSGKYKVRSKDQLEECKQIVYAANGWVLHQGATDLDDPSGAKENHGDRPTAGALCCKVISEGEPERKKPQKEVVFGSLAHRRQLSMMSERKRDEW